MGASLPAFYEEMYAHLLTYEGYDTAFSMCCPLFTDIQVSVKAQDGCSYVKNFRLRLQERYSVYMRPAVSTSTVSHESEIAHRWWAISPSSLLPLSDGGLVQIVFPGHPGGSAGPDVCDAVLCLPASLYPVAHGELQSGLPEKYVGDVEFHIRASDWEAH